MLEDAALDLFGERQDVRRPSALQGDQEVGVAPAHLGQADAEALEAGLLDEQRGRPV